MEKLENEIEKLEEFASDLQKYFENSKSSALFKKLPLREKVDERQQRFLNGLYLFRPCGIELQLNDLNRIAIELLDLLKKHLPDRNDDISFIAPVLIEEKIKTKDLLMKIIKNEGSEIRKEIRLHNIAEDLFTFFSVYLARPFREKAAEYLLDGISKPNWFQGYCPVCGHWPALSHLYSENGQRTLWCLCCNTKWNFKRTQCAFCLNENHEQLEVLNPENQESFRVQVCNKCKRYLKEVKSDIGLKDFPFDKFYLGTLPLDIIAEQEGYIQESVLTVRYDNPEGNELLIYRQKELKE